jgi:hypothetical protein
LSACCVSSQEECRPWLRGIDKGRSPLIERLVSYLIEKFAILSKDFGQPGRNPKKFRERGLSNITHREEPLSSVKLDIIMFWFMNDWGQYGRAYERIAENLSLMSEVRRVICLFPPTEAESPSWPMRLQFVTNKLCVVTLSAIVKPEGRPYRIRQIINKSAVKLALIWIRRSLRLEKETTFLWMYPPHEFIYKILHLIPNNLLITQVVDNNAFRESAGTAYRSFARDQYQRLAEISDVVLTSSQINYEVFSAQSKVCAFFENAVDKRFIFEPSELPCRLNGSRPRLVYVGFISERTDLNLLEYIAKERLGYDLIIAGPFDKGSSIDAILKYNNVYYLGEVPYDEVPQLIQTMDVCLIPHLVTPYSKSMSPLKLYQYLGSGRPVVSTKVAGVEKFSGLVSIAEDHDAFLKAIDQNLLEDNVTLRRKRIEIAKSETWEKRTKDMFSCIYKHYLNK